MIIVSCFIILILFETIRAFMKMLIDCLVCVNNNYFLIDRLNLSVFMMQIMPIRSNYYTQTKNKTENMSQNNSKICFVVVVVVEINEYNKHEFHKLM